MKLYLKTNWLALTIIPFGAQAAPKVERSPLRGASHPAQNMRALQIMLSLHTYGECEGDCDSSSDCDWGLNCFERDSNESVPGCLGEGVDGADYCYVPPPGVLVLAGNNNSPASAFPLQECQADCDRDSDCGWGLVCLQRSADEPVPGCTGEALTGEDYCVQAQPGELVLMGDEDLPAENFPLGACEGDCDNDGDCEGDLKCFQRSGWEAVPGCDGDGNKRSDYCYIPPPPLVFVQDGGIPDFSLGECEGDCDDDDDCDFGLICFQRSSGIQDVPGCSGNADVVGDGNDDFCVQPPTSKTLVLMGDEDLPASAYPLEECQGDCDSDWDCDWGSICFQRNGDEPVPGCTGSGLTTEDYCIKPPAYTLVIMGDEDEPAENFPLGECEGDCDNDGDCAGSLVCFQRSGTEAVPFCDGQGQSGTDYCYDPDGQRTGPPKETPPPGTVTYRPGEATVYENGLLLSTGLTSRIIATKNTRVQYDTGGQSSEDFHSAPDGAAVFEDPDTGGWIYVSNSESGSDGGVGAITFDSQGNVVNYQRLLSGTSRNCGGGKTFYGTWLTCEEHDNGQVWEVDPWGINPPRQTITGNGGMNYESAAYDNRDPLNVKFYITVDETDGPLVKFTPDADATQYAVDNNDYSDLLHTNGPTVKYEYFRVTSLNSNGEGTYEWTDDIGLGRTSAQQYHIQGEGIDIRNGELFYTTKAQKYLFTIDLDNGTFLRTSTNSGAFDSQPDQVARVLNFTDGSTDGILYFCEDGGDECGVHGRDANGQFFTILQDGGSNFGGETTGLAFSPDGMFMYVSFQSPGHIFEIRRLDGFPFQGSTLDIKYHDSGDNTNPFRERELAYSDNAKTCDLVSASCNNV